MLIGLLVSVVDDDPSVRESLPHFLRQLGYLVRAFYSAEEFLDSAWVSETRCLILDIALPGMSGPHLQRELERRGHSIPIIYITALDDETLRDSLLSQGAVDCLSKPFLEADLIRALDAAIATRNTKPENYP
jgi:FixJ family two-component response regulator